MRTTKLDTIQPREPERRFELRTVQGRLVQPGLDLDRTSALLTDEDESRFCVEED